MATTTETLTAFDGSKIETAAGHHQDGFIICSVNRFAGEYMADVSSVTHIDVSNKKTAIQNVMDEATRCINIVHKSKINSKLYDFQNGQYSRTHIVEKKTKTATPQAETPAAVTPAAIEIPALEVPADKTPAEKTPEQPTSEMLNASCMEWLKIGRTETEWSEAMLKAGVTQESLNQLKPAETEAVSIPPPQ